MVSSPASTVAAEPVGWRFDNTYAHLPDTLFASAQPAPMREPRVSIPNDRLAKELGLDLEAVTPEAIAAMFAGQDLPSGSLPIAQDYAGHQYGGFTMLGDGRAILFGRSAKIRTEDDPLGRPQQRRAAVLSNATLVSLDHFLGYM